MRFGGEGLRFGGKGLWFGGKGGGVAISSSEALLDDSCLACKGEEIRELEVKGLGGIGGGLGGRACI